MRKFDVFGVVTLSTTRLVSRELAAVEDASAAGEISVSSIRGSLKGIKHGTEITQKLIQINDRSNILRLTKRKSSKKVEKENLSSRFIRVLKSKI